MLSNNLLSCATSVKEVIFVGRKIQGFSGSTSDITMTYNGQLSGGISSSVAVGDFVFVHCSVADNDADPETNDYVVSGYTEQAELFQSDSTSTTLLLAYKFLSSVENNVVLVGGSKSTSASCVICVSVFRNVDTETPFDVSGKATLTSNSGIPNPPSITPSTNNSLILVAGAGGGASITSYTSNDLTSFVSAESDGTLYDSCLGVGHVVGNSGIAFDANAFGLVGNNSSNYSAIAAVRVLRAKV